MMSFRELVDSETTLAELAFLKQLLNFLGGRVQHFLQVMASTKTFGRATLDDNDSNVTVATQIVQFA